MNGLAGRTFFGPLVIAVALCAALAPAGCRKLQELRSYMAPEQSTFLPILPGEQATGVMTYPAEAPVGEPVDIEVIRLDNARLQLDNRTAHAYHDVPLWLNHEFGRIVEDVPIGRSEVLILESFANHHGEAYPIGRFLKPDRNRPLVMADLFADGRLRKLTVRLEENWQIK